ncbi:related to DNA repair protein RAD26 [Rhynchosporium graminicola]|uniref:Related to DNA repair protein RAD26 n=1 Tax=Rhynchosporium graminicola TaxID=2792576 RepID=A0A1E1L7C9_9HELO|nr:related to DNA repair protein RAD26 [Rhynchosporium commune]
MACAEHQIDEQTEDDDELSTSDEIGRTMGTDEYIKRINRRRLESDTDSDREVTGIAPSPFEKGKRKAGEKVEWSSDDGEEEDAYQKFKNRKSAKRKRVAATRKKLKEKTKEIVEDRKKAKNNGENSKQQRMWGDESDYEILDDEIPEYVRQRRKEFDKNHEQYHEDALRLPPRYEDVYFSDDERIAELAERPDFPPSVESSREYKDIELPHSAGVIPASIAQYLRDYQVTGVGFLHELFVYQRGGLLGDDMGLGKTVQVAAFLTAAFGKTGDERDAKRMRKMRRAPNKPWYPRVLIVCPGSLMDNWKNELGRWGFWHVDKYYGSKGERESVAQAALSGRVEIVITTYTTYRNHLEQLNQTQWDCVVADECHQLKEPSAETTKAMNQVNALCRIGLSGTAIQNKYDELWTLLNWTNPGRFGPLQVWKSSISDPLKMGQSHDCTNHQLKQARQTAEKLRANLLPQFFLRRMKSLIAHQLPKKTDKVVFCPLTSLQKQAYEYFLESPLVETVRNSADECDCGKPGNPKRGWCCYTTIPGSDTSWRAVVFPAISILQKLSNHLAILIPNPIDPPEKRERDLERLKEMLPNHWRDLYENRGSLATLSNPEFCGKWAILKKLLKYWHEQGDKVLIFSHSVRLLELLQYLFNNTSYTVSFLSGKTKNDDRQKLVDSFNSDPNQFVFLISTKAGGVGLNITSANKVVIFDPNWNPSYDLQAQDRAYRIGQLRDVEVYRLVSAGTVEEIVYARQIYKQQQANIGYTASTERRYFKGVQNMPGQKGEIFGLHNLLTFHADSVVLRDIVNKTNVAEAKRGVDILDFDMDDAANDEDNPLKVDDLDDEDGAMSQLAALLTEDSSKKQPKPRPKTDPIQAILAAAGVEYTHENSEVVGSSRVEAELSRRAVETGNDAEYGEQRLFDDSQAGDVSPGRIHYEYHPPDDVMLRQFCTMSKGFGFGSATEFAFAVEGMTQKQRTYCLERFYLKRKERIAELELQENKSKTDGPAVSAVGLDMDVEMQAELHEARAAERRAVESKAAVRKLEELKTPNAINEDAETEDDDDDEL